MRRIRLRWPLWVPMVLIAGSSILFVTIRPLWPSWVESFERWRANRPVHAQLARTVPLGIRGRVPLSGLIAAIERATRGPDLPKGLPILLDAMGMRDVGTSPAGTVDVPTNAPLREVLRGAMRPLGLDFVVVDGRVIVGNPVDLPAGDR